MLDALVLFVGLAWVSWPVRLMVRHCRDRWPSDIRPRHEACPSCHCSYRTTPELTRHYRAQHTDETTRWPLKENR